MTEPYLTRCLARQAPPLRRAAAAPPHAMACLAAALLLALGSAQAAADEHAGIDWHFGGFGTLGAVHSSERLADFTANVINPGQAGYTHQWSAAVDSRLGAQLDATLGSDWSAVLQVVSERNLYGNYRPQVEWANVKYQATPELSIRLGRIALPMYLAGDYRKVGYALPWVRPPVEVYGGLPISRSDGIDASYRTSMAGVASTTQLFYGHTAFGTGTFGATGTSAHARANAIIGISTTGNYGALTVRASAMTAKLTVDLAAPLFDAFRQFGASGNALADQYGIDNKRVLVGSVGASYDPGNWFLMSEWSRLDARSFLGDKRAWYAGAGYRAGAWTPYLSYASVNAADPIGSSGIATAGLPPQAAAQAAYLNQTLNALLRTTAVQHTVSAGVRWDVARDMALKLQYDRLRSSGGSNGTLINVQPGFQSGRPVHVTSLALDFLF